MWRGEGEKKGKEKPKIIFRAVKNDDWGLFSSSQCRGKPHSWVPQRNNLQNLSCKWPQEFLQGIRLYQLWSSLKYPDLICTLLSFPSRETLPHFLANTLAQIDLESSWAHHSTEQHSRHKEISDPQQHDRARATSTQSPRPNISSRQIHFLISICGKSRLMSCLLPSP